MTARSFLVLFALGFFVICEIARPVVPAPDGGYPGFNTADGQNALPSQNTVNGAFALLSNATGACNARTESPIPDTDILINVVV